MSNSENKKLSEGIPRMPANRTLNSRERLGDFLYLSLQLISRLGFIPIALVAYFEFGILWSLLSAAAGLVIGIWMRHSMGIRGPDPWHGWFQRKREIAMGGRRGVLEWLIEKARTSEFSKEKCREIVAAYDEAMSKLRHCSSENQELKIIDELDARVKEISYCNRSN